METNISKIQEEIKKELSNKDVLNALVATTFKGLEVQQIYLAIQEGLIRGFTFKDFLEKNIYAIPFVENRGRPNERQTYSLVTSIDYARKIGMRSSVVGKTAPTFEEDNGKVISCTVTIKRLVSGIVGDFTATVYFSEYTTGRNQWTSKPRTMIAKVAEMHALRMACPEEMSQVYVEEEIEKETQPKQLEPIDLTIYGNKLKEAKTIADLGREWSALPFVAKQKLETLKNEMKAKLSSTK